MAQWTQRINARMNDAYGNEFEGTHYWWPGGTTIQVPANDGSFFRFDKVYVAAGATITSAYVKMTADWGTANALNIKVRAIDEDNTDDYTTNARLRDRTTAAIDWDIPTWTVGTEYTSPDIKTVIQEVIDRSGWDGGNAIGIVLEDDGSPFGANSAESYEGNTTIAARIEINYTGSTTTPQTIEVRAKIINPPFDMGIVVAKPTYNVIDDKDPTHHIFNSDYPTLKYFVSGSISVLLPAFDYAAVNSYTHNLGYEPYVEIYAETTLGGIYQPCPYEDSGATVFYGTLFRVTPTKIDFFAFSTGFFSNQTFYFKFFIFRNRLFPSTLP